MVKPGGFYKRAFLKRAWHLALALVGPTFLHPLTLVRVIRRLPMAGGLSYDADEALLASIAVDPALQSKGIGGKLVDQFLVQAKAKGARTVYLATQALNNENINRFYQRKGFSCRRIVLMPEDRQMNEYWRPI